MDTLVLTGAIPSAGEARVFPAASVSCPEPVMDDLRHVFRWKMDFPTDLRPGDTFRAVVLSPRSQGSGATTSGTDRDVRILGAEVSARGRTSRAVWFRSPGRAQRGYFEFDGSPVGSSRIPTPDGFQLTSRFSWGRFHPVLRERRPHLGLDYAVPYGETVRAVAPGRVTRVARVAGFGLVVEIRHDAHRSTRYAHLSSVAPEIVTGRRVESGTEVGRAGATGMATAPHLHFEYLLDGQRRDPLHQASSEISRTAPAADLPAFIEQRERIVELLETRSPPDPTAGAMLAKTGRSRVGEHTPAAMMITWVAGSGPLPGTEETRPIRWPVPAKEIGDPSSRDVPSGGEIAPPGDPVCAVGRSGDLEGYRPPYSISSTGTARRGSATGMP